MKANVSPAELVDKGLVRPNSSRMQTDSKEAAGAFARIKQNHRFSSAADIIALQRTVGNRAVVKMLGQKGIGHNKHVQREEVQRESIAVSRVPDTAPTGQIQREVYRATPGQILDRGAFMGIIATGGGLRHAVKTSDGSYLLSNETDLAAQPIVLMGTKAEILKELSSQSATRVVNRLLLDEDLNQAPANNKAIGIKVTSAPVNSSDPHKTTQVISPGLDATKAITLSAAGLAGGVAGAHIPDTVSTTALDTIGAAKGGAGAAKDVTKSKKSPFGWLADIFDPMANLKNKENAPVLLPEEKKYLVEINGIGDDHVIGTDHVTFGQIHAYLKQKWAAQYVSPSTYNRPKKEKRKIYQERMERLRRQ